MKTVIAFTDGGCRNNGRPNAVGAYGVVLKFTDTTGKTHIKEISQGFKNVTNNQMELMGAIVALESLKEPCEVILISDSKYVVSAINQNWIIGWIKNGWKNSSKQPVKNKELWMRLIPLLNTHNVKVFWTKGHADDEGNNRADELCNIEMDKYLETERTLK